MTQGIPDSLAELWRHGGRLDEAMRLFPDSPRPWLDLSTGINPRAWSPPALPQPDARALPTMAALRGLEAAAADWFGTSPERLAAVPGSDLLIRLLPQLLPRAPLRAVVPGYASHLEAAVGAVSLGDAANSLRRGDNLLFANPSNPEGHLLGRAELLDLVGQGGWLVLDEAFADATPGSSLAPHLHGEEPVILLRSFGKFFGLAGLRLGFAIAPPAVIQRLRVLLGDWPVSAHAIAWGAAAYRDRDWITQTQAFLGRQAAALDALLAQHGLAGDGACPLFRLVRHEGARAIFRRLARAGILARPFEHQPDWLRFGLPADDDALSRLRQALAHG